jgi:hypothetical protein
MIPSVVAKCFFCNSYIFAVTCWVVRKGKRETICPECASTFELSRKDIFAKVV